MKRNILDAAGKGEGDYDYVNDILFFKVKNREYDHSIELDNIVVDLDKKNFIVGIQILEASEFLRVKKEALRTVPVWHFDADLNDHRIEIRLLFTAIIRNKPVELNPIIRDNVPEDLPNLQTICAPVV